MKDPGIEALEAIWSDPKGVRVAMLSLVAKQRIRDLERENEALRKVLGRVLPDRFEGLLIQERRELLAKGR